MPSEGYLLLSTAYFPPIEYVSLILNSQKVLIEHEENFLKQSYRNRCRILTTHGIHRLTVPVYLGSLHKTKIKDIRIDYSKRWQQIHLGAIISAYSSSPYFEHYFDTFRSIIEKNHSFLLSLNMELTDSILGILKYRKPLEYTTEFEPVAGKTHDYRYSISPKLTVLYTGRSYIQVFSENGGFTPNLSIIDLVFNTGPDAISYL
jgi:hypothetical protein